MPEPKWGIKYQKMSKATEQEIESKNANFFLFCSMLIAPKLNEMEFHSQKYCVHEWNRSGCTDLCLQTLFMAVYVVDMEKKRWNDGEKTMQGNMNAEVLNWFSARQR